MTDIYFYYLHVGVAYITLTNMKNINGKKIVAAGSDPSKKRMKSLLESLFAFNVNSSNAYFSMVA